MPRTMRKIVAIAAMSGTALASVLTYPAVATPLAPPVGVADDTTLDAMQAQCDALAAAKSTGINGRDIWSAEVVLGQGTLVDGPTQVGERDIDEDTLVGIGFTPSGLFIDGEPYRVGGSVNMFGIQRATGGSYSSSTYFYDADFETTFSFSFSCDLYKEVYVPEQRNIISPDGYVINDDGNGGDENENPDGTVGGPRVNCEQLTNNGQPWWGEPFRPSASNPRCVYVPAEIEVIPEYWEAPILAETVAGTPVTQVQTDYLRGFEANGSGYSIGGDIVIGQVVVCISPSTTGNKGNPGAWRAQNGYSGANCNTTYFNSAPWGAGSTTSQGTYITVPPQ